MPWDPQQFSAQLVLELARARDVETLGAVSYFDGLLAGDPDALVRSFAGVPELHHPIQGRVRGVEAFTRYVRATADDLRARNAEVASIDLIVTGPRTIEEVVLSYDGDEGRVQLPVAIVADRQRDGLIDELRIYFSTWPITGGHAARPPLLQVDPGLDEPPIIAEYFRALAAGEIDALLATLEPEASIREPSGEAFVHRGTAAHREMYEFFFSNGGGVQLQHGSCTSDGRATALEYNVVQWGTTVMAPQAGIAIYVLGGSGKIAEVRIYDDANPPLSY